MKVCFVRPDPFGRRAAGDEALQQTLLAQALARRGYETSMVVGDDGRPDGAPWEGIRTFRARSRWVGLWPALARADADVYYASGARAPSLQLALFCVVRDRRLVLRPAHPPGPGLRGAHVLVAGSAAEQRLLARQGLRSRLAGRLFETAPPAAERDIEVLWASPMRGLSRPDRALSLARRLPLARVHMAGGPLAGDEALFREIRRMAGELANLSFHGALARGEALALLGRARLLLVADDDGGPPYARLRAWANGVPVAALSDPGGLIAREGLGVAAARSSALFDAVRALLADEAAWSATSARCRRYMARAHSEARVVHAYVSAFESARRRGAPAGRVPLHA